MSDKQSTIVEGLQKYFLIGALLLLLVTLFIFVQPLLIDLLFAGVVVTAVWPVHRLIRRGLPTSRSFSALLSLVLVTTLVVLPFVFFIFFVAEQASGAYINVSQRIEEIAADDGTGTPLIARVIEKLPFSERIEEALTYMPLTSTDFLTTVGDVLGSVSGFLIGKTTDVLKHLAILIIHLIVFLMTVFYLFRDGDRLVNYIYSLLPLSQKYRKELFYKLNHLSYGIIYGIFGAAILQGFLLGVGLQVAGVSNAAFWGSVAALFSPVPYIGTSVIWIPIVLSVGVSGHWLAAGLLSLWCALIVGTADNLIKPFLIGSSTSLHPLSTFFVFLGGLLAFGPKGIFYGPLILTLALAFLHIYRLEYAGVLEKEDELVCVPVSGSIKPSMLRGPKPSKPAKKRNPKRNGKA